MYTSEQCNYCTAPSLTRALSRSKYSPTRYTYTTAAQLQNTEQHVQVGPYKEIRAPSNTPSKNNTHGPKHAQWMQPHTENKLCSCCTPTRSALKHAQCKCPLQPFEGLELPLSPVSHSARQTQSAEAITGVPSTAMSTAAHTKWPLGNSTHQHQACQYRQTADAANSTQVPNLPAINNWQAQHHLNPNKTLNMPQTVHHDLAHSSPCKPHI